MEASIDNRGRVESRHGGLEWHTEGRIIHAWVIGDWTNKSAAFFNEQFRRKIEESKWSQVHIVFDTAHMEKVLVSPNSTVRQLNYLQHEKLGKAILFGVPMPQRAIVGLLINVLNGTFRGKVGLARDLDGALADVHSNTPPQLLLA